MLHEIEDSLTPAFSTLIQTVFLYDCPENVASHIFEVFLIDGEQVLITILLKTIELREKKILSLQGIDLLRYVRQDMIQEVIVSTPMMYLLD